MRNKSRSLLSLTLTIELEAGGRACSVAVLDGMSVEPCSELVVKAPHPSRGTGRGRLAIIAEGDARH